MRLVIDERYPTALRDEIETLVRREFAEVADETLAVHVKGVAPRPRWFLPCQRETCRPNIDLDLDPQVGREVAEHFGIDRGHLRRTRKAARACHDDAHTADVFRWVEHRRPCGWAYDGVPLRHVRPLPGIRRLVTIRMSLQPGQLRYPHDWQYPGLKTSGAVTYRCWREELLHTLAHEARHIAQFCEGLPRSEVDAEQHAHGRLHLWRTHQEPARGAGSQAR